MRCHAPRRPYATGVLLDECRMGGCTPPRASSEQMRLKRAQLFVGLRAGVVGGRREMCHQAFQPRVLGCADGFQDLRGEARVPSRPMPLSIFR